MNESDKIALLENLLTDKEVAFAGSSPDAPALSKIVSQLNGLSKEDKPYFKEFAIKLKEDLFNKSVTIKGLSIDAFLNIEAEAKPETSDESQESKLSEVQIEFSELFKKLTQNRPDHFEILKGYFIVKLENNPLEPYKLMVLFDPTYFIQPIKKR